MHMRVRMLGTFKTGLAMLVLLVWVIVTPAPIQAQVSGASLSGTVNDTSGAPLVGAKVAIENLATGVSRDTATDAVGSIPHRTYCRERTRSQFQRPGLRRGAEGCHADGRRTVDHKLHHAGWRGD